MCLLFHSPKRPPLLLLKSLLEHSSPRLQDAGANSRTCSYRRIRFIWNTRVALPESVMKLRYAMVCSSNQNRSMESHFLLKREGFDVASYGTGQHVKLPGPSIREPNVYDFGTPYKQMFDDLRRKDVELYKRNGILPMLKRNLGVKLAPQRWQDNAADGPFDVVITFEEKVFDLVLEEQPLNRHLQYEAKLSNDIPAIARTWIVVNLGRVRKVVGDAREFRGQGLPGKCCVI
ncbi:hypothetical protein KY290_018125 [Solanum tuberosum]|uniref:RNA polymerase II subunit A C-terminal domain phosphatase SSU72 n=1 Tax=Solanum tuberosum TaxID=4113 RepID=A0ABQ7VFD4_SOLTU|nr:hypothetical protein KY285_017095 [Solanum tuberosum]KAH0762052.1 hypothetical protein KY290_018125 [Solanum tuberosum]